MLVPQRRDVVVLLAAGPTPASAVPRHPGTVSQASETSYVYYTTIPQFCAVTTSTGGQSAVVLPASSGNLAGGLVNTVWAPGTVVRGPIPPTSQASDAAVSQNGNATTIVLSTSPDSDTDWTGTGLVQGPVAKSCTEPAESGTSKHRATVAGGSDEAAKSAASPTARDPSGSDALEGSTPSTTSRTFTCSECSRDFASEKYLNMHMSLHLQSAAMAPQGAAADAVASPSLLGGVPEVTITTPMMLTAQQQLIMAPPPIRRTKMTTVGVGGTSCTSQWTCQICEKTFAQNSNYKNHIRTHSNERPFVCEICAIG